MFLKPDYYNAAADSALTYRTNESIKVFANLDPELKARVKTFSITWTQAGDFYVPEIDLEFFEPVLSPSE
jgi:hypothetical protein